METQIAIIDDAVAFLLGIINYIERTKVTMINSYPAWDETDVEELKTLATSRLLLAITKLEAL